MGGAYVMKHSAAASLYEAIEAAVRMPSSSGRPHY